MLTVVSRVIGFGRTWVLTLAVGQTDLGSVYASANAIPNIIFEIVAGGAMAALVVPLLAAPVAAGDRDEVSRTTSALLSWVLALLTPLALIVVAGADWVIRLVAGNGWTPEMLSAGAGMLRVFAIQIPLYGLGVVLIGVLQSHRRFAWPVIAPLLSSLVVIGTYALFAAVDGARATLAESTSTGRAILAVGTTLGVVVLSGCLLIPLRSLRLRVRPHWRFTNPNVPSLAVSGLLTVLAQQIALIVALRLANQSGGDGAALVFTVAQTVFLLPWAVLAVPAATAAYPALAESAATGDRDAYQRVLARTTRAVTVLSCLGVALLAGVAGPAAAFLSKGADPAPLAWAIAAFAPGLLGYGVAALFSRALYARGRQRAAAVCFGLGWGTAAIMMPLLAWALPQRIAALGLATSVGMTVLGVALLAAVRRDGATMPGLARAGIAGLLAAGLGAAAGNAVVWLAGGLPSAAAGVIVLGIAAAVAVIAVFGGVVLLLDGGDLRAIAARRLRRGEGGAA
ncbi:murein biosynthesis integral membrane protein MurJ [Hamadaea tsunoensis]|uniref:murein biosynthesis integral membrane protein MurJ n=1 Tax=Hamadaea tsunoensis TaxID=53368 RepID=UPI001FE23022|nr:lipid II flippase MurJ [Hamadaea tsunoensis]